MLFPTAGCRFFTADIDQIGSPPHYGALPVIPWVEISETEALGTLGSEWEMDEEEVPDETEEDSEILYAKRTLRRGQMQVIVGNDPADPGQMLLWKAHGSKEGEFPFRLVFPDGITGRVWFGLVTGLFEVFDAANNVVRLQFTIQPTSAVQTTSEV